MSLSPAKPLRLLIVLPSWVGDTVMATPTLRLIRGAFPGIFMGGLARPGIEQLLAGTDFFDELHVERAQGMMGPKRVANKVRPRRYDTALLLANSMSSALNVRLAGIPRRLGYDRDARGLLLTSKINPPKERSGPRKGRDAIVSTEDYYYNLARHVLLPLGKATSQIGHAGAPLEALTPGTFVRLPPLHFMELGTTPEDEALAGAILTKAGLAAVPGDGGTPFAILNPGGNALKKRWPADRFAAIGSHLVTRHGLGVVINGSPGEAELCDEVARRIVEESARVGAAARVANLARLGNTLGSLKVITRQARLMVTNDTGPRHIAAAVGTPLVSLFGPTDHRVTTIPTRAGAPEEVLIADPTLPPEEIANEHQERCRMDRIEVESVRDAVDRTCAMIQARASDGIDSHRAP